MMMNVGFLSDSERGVDGQGSDGNRGALDKFSPVHRDFNTRDAVVYLLWNFIPTIFVAI
jgi:hypothetical protein